MKVDGQTEFDDSGHGLDSIADGDRVEVHGFPDDSGAIRATRIEKHEGQNEDFEVKGFVSDLQAGGHPADLHPEGHADARPTPSR